MGRWGVRAHQDICRPLTAKARQSICSLLHLDPGWNWAWPLTHAWGCFGSVHKPPLREGKCFNHTFLPWIMGLNECIQWYKQLKLLETKGNSHYIFFFYFALKKRWLRIIWGYFLDLIFWDKFISLWGKPTANSKLFRCSNGAILGSHVWSDKDHKQRLFDFLDSFMSLN